MGGGPLMGKGVRYETKYRNNCNCRLAYGIGSLWTVSGFTADYDVRTWRRTSADEFAADFTNANGTGNRKKHSFTVDKSGSGCSQCRSTAELPSTAAVSTKKHTACSITRERRLFTAKHKFATRNDTSRAIENSFAAALLRHFNDSAVR